MKTIFVSSTFKDMQYERDIIREKVLPGLNNIAQQYSQRVSFCDLRWGVNTSDLDSDAGSKKVLNVCFDEIDRSMPPMVVILGDRYGWIPDKNLIMTAAERKKIQLDDYRQSVTALEIEYGALSDSKKQQSTLFYFREIENDVPSDYTAEDELHKQKLDALKAKIFRLTNGNVRYYKVKWNGNGFDGIDEFGKMLYDDLSERLTKEWSFYSLLTPFQQELLTHSRFIEEKSSMFRARKRVAEQIIENIEKGNPLSIIKGDSGSGKSTLFSFIATELKQKGHNVLPFISGLSIQSNDAMDILMNFVRYFEDELELSHFDDETETGTGRKIYHSLEEWRSRLDNLCAQYVWNGKKIILMVDAVDQLFDNEDRENLIFMPRNLNENVQMVISCLTELNLPDYDYYKLHPLDESDKREVILGTIAATGKELADRVVNEMVSLPAADNPLFLSLLIQRLTMMNRFDFEVINSGNSNDQMTEITKRQLEIIKNCPHELNAMCVELLDEVGRRINPVLVRKTTEYIAVSRYGMRAEDLWTLMKDDWNQADFSNFIHYLSESFIQRDDGRYDFSHKSIREGFRSICKNEKELHWKILLHTYFERRNMDFVKNEFAYHCIKADLKSVYKEYIEEYMYSDDEAIEIAAKTTYELCLIDDGKWICDFLCDDVCLRSDYLLVDFINAKLSNKFNINSKEFFILNKILEANLELTKKIKERDPSDINHLLLACCYTTLSDSYRNMGGINNLMKSLDYAEQALPEFEKNHNIENNNYSLSSLSYAYERIAETKFLIGGRENYEAALPLYSTAFECRKKLFDNGFFDINEIGDLYKLKQRIASIYTNFGSAENIQRSDDIHFEILDEFIKHSSEFTSPYAKRSLAVAHERVAEIYIRIGGIDNFNKALSHIEQAESINRIIYNDIPVKTALTDISRLYEARININVLIGGKENFEEAYRLLNKDKLNRMKIYQLTQTETAFWEYCRIITSISDTLRHIGGSDAINTAIALIQETLDLIHETPELLTTLDAKLILSSVHEQLSLLYLACDDPDNSKIEEELKTLLRLRTELEKEQKTPQSKRGIELCYVQLSVHMYTYTDNYSESLMYLQKASAIADELYSESADALYAVDRARASLHIANAYMAWDVHCHSDIIIDTLNKTIDLAEKIYRETAIYDSAEVFAIAYNQLVSVYVEIEDGKHFDVYCEQLEKYFVLFTELTEKYNTVSIKTFYCNCVVLLSYIYTDGDDPEKHKKAFNMLTNAIAMARDMLCDNDSQESEMHLAAMLAEMAELLQEETFGEDMQKAFDLMTEACELYLDLAEKSGSESDYTDAANAYYDTGMICMRTDGDENNQQALELMVKAYELYSENVSQQSDSDILYKYSQCLMNIAFLHACRCNADVFSNEELTVMIRTAVEIERMVANESGDAEDIYVLASDCEKSGFIFKQFDSKEYNKIATDMYAEALELYITLINDHGYEYALADYAECYCSLAEMNENEGEETNNSSLLDKAIQQRLEAVDAYEMLLKNNRDEDILQAYMLCCCFIVYNERCDDSLYAETLEKAYKTAKYLYSINPCDDYLGVIQEIEELL